MQTSQGVVQVPAQSSAFSTGWTSLGLLLRSQHAGESTCVHRRWALVAGALDQQGGGGFAALRLLRCRDGPPVQCKPGQCALAHHPEATELVHMMQERGYPCCHALEFLGIHFDLEHLSCFPLKLDMENVKWRIRYLRRLGAPLAMLKLLVSSLISSTLFWASGVAKPSKEDLKLVANELYYLFQGSFLSEAPKVLIHELMGWRSEPQFACDMAAFQAVTRHLSRTPEWKEQAPLIEAFGNWQAVFPLSGKGWQNQYFRASTFRTSWIYQQKPKHYFQATFFRLLPKQIKLTAPTFSSLDLQTKLVLPAFWSLDLQKKIV